MPATLEDERIKALTRPIVGKYPELARELRRLMGHGELMGHGDSNREFLTARMAADLCDLNHTTVADVLRGHRPSEGSLLRLAQGLGGDPALLLRLARYPSGRALPPTAPTPADGEDALLALFRALSPRARRLLLSLAESVRDSDDS